MKLQYRIKLIGGRHRLQVKSQMRDAWITVKSSDTTRAIYEYMRLHNISMEDMK